MSRHTHSGLVRLLATVRTRVIDFPAGDWALNLNTPDDYTAALVPAPEEAP
jgi:hypothetical protein